MASESRIVINNNNIERKVVVTTPRTMRAARITAFRRPLQADDEANAQQKLLWRMSLW